MKAKIAITPKAAVLDPQGMAVGNALRQMGHEGIRDVRVGRYLELDLESDTPEARKDVLQACQEFLSNPVIEDFNLSFE